MRFTRLLVMSILAFSVAIRPSNVVAENSIVVDAEPLPWVLDCLDETTVRPFDDPKMRAIVLVFVSTDCPIANAYHPQLTEIAAEYQPKGIAFFLVHSSSDVSVAAARSHADDFSLKIPVVMDASQRIAKRVAAKVTPEAIVLRRGDNKPVYRGAIDNLYEGYGKKRRRANKHHLRDAMNQLLAGEQIAVPVTKPLGCFISYADR